MSKKEENIMRKLVLLFLVQGFIFNYVYAKPEGDAFIIKSSTAWDEWTVKNFKEYLNKDSKDSDVRFSVAKSPSKQDVLGTLVAHLVILRDGNSKKTNNCNTYSIKFDGPFKARSNTRENSCGFLEEFFNDLNLASEANHLLFLVDKCTRGEKEGEINHPGYYPSPAAYSEWSERVTLEVTLYESDNVRVCLPADKKKGDKKAENHKKGKVKIKKSKGRAVSSLTE